MMFCVLPASQNAVILLHLYDDSVAWWVQSFYVKVSEGKSTEWMASVLLGWP